MLLTESTVVARAPGLVPLRREGRLLVVSMATGGSVLLEGDRLRAWQGLDRPRALGELARLHPSADVPALLSLLRSRGMLSVAGAPPERPAARVAGPRYAAVVTVHLPGGPMPPLPPGRLLLDVRGADGCPAAVRPVVKAARTAWDAPSARTAVDVVVRTAGPALPSLVGLGVEAVLELRSLPSGDVLSKLDRALEAGLPVAPLGIVSSPSLAHGFFEAFMGLGYRTFRLEPAGEGLGEAFLEVADLVLAHYRRTRSPVVVHPLARMARYARSGRGLPPCPHPECGSGRAYVEVGPDGAVATRPAVEAEPPRCGRCAFHAMCCGGCGHRRTEAECAFYRTVYEGLLWRLHESPELASALGG